jgi:hypothetical protein
VTRAGAVGVLLAVVALGTAPAASARDDPARLWSRFPLEGERVVRPDGDTAVMRPARSPQTPARARSGRGDSDSVDPLLATAVGGGLLLALLLSIWPARRRGARLAIDAAECDKVTPQFPLQRSASVSAQSPETRPPTPPTEQDTPPETASAAAATTSYADIGERVAGVLAAAEQAAAQITSDAEQQAAGVRRQAEQTAASRVDQARQEADKVRADAERDVRDTREAVDSYAAQRRREAEEQSQRMLAEAEAEARAVREAAEQMASRIEATARRRQEALHEESRLVEARLHRALEGFRQMTTRLEELLETPEQPDAEESLVQALDVERRRQPTA